MKKTFPGGIFCHILVGVADNKANSAEVNLILGCAWQNVFYKSGPEKYTEQGSTALTKGTFCQGLVTKDINTHLI